MSTTATNRYCERLGFVATPRVEDLVGGRDTMYQKVSLFTLTIVALLERGEPMHDDDIADRLYEAGVDAESGVMALSIRRAWHGLAPMVRDGDGRLALDLSWGDWGFFLRRHRLQAPRPVLMEPTPAPEIPADDVPLSIEELDAAFAGRSMHGLSPLRQAAAVLDAHGGPMTVATIDAVLARLSRRRSALTPQTARGWQTTLVTALDDGRLALDVEAPGLLEMRRAVRKWSHPELVRRVRQADSARHAKAYDARHAAEMAREAEESAQLRRALVRTVPEGHSPPLCAALLDVTTRTFHTWADPSGFAHALGQYDVLVGLHVRPMLEALGLDADRWRILDLKPPKKTHTVNKAGRKLTITPELLISATTGISRPLGDGARVAEHLDSGDQSRLARRLESDLKSFWAFYQYGVLHGAVRLRWGFVDEWLGVDWRLPGEPSVWEILGQAEKTGATIEVVTGSAPGWTDPWARAIRGRVVALAVWTVTVATTSGLEPIERRQIQAVRVVTG